MSKVTGASPAITKVVAKLLENLDTDLASGALERLYRNDWSGLDAISVDPSSYPATPDGALQFRADYQVAEIARKRTFGGDITKRDRRLAALTSWHDSEHRNYLTNQRLSLLMSGEFCPGPQRVPMDDSATTAVILETVDCMKNEIARVLGRIPRELSGRFSSGTNEGPIEVYHTIVHKLLQPSCTPELAEALRYNCRGLALPHAWERALLNSGISINSLPLVRGEGFGTVPKNYKTDRTIGKQPVVNLFFQLGVGEHIRSRLLTVACIDLNNGHLTHSRLAYEGSISNAYATIDLRNASNSLAKQVVKLLLPEQWFDLLDLIRSKAIRIEGKWQKLEMFAAMGNGFTFELETLIFWAACRACGVVSPHVYGDDIIVPTTHARAVIALLSFLGFETNKDKTFIDGPFRESCGANFFAGVDVTPIRFTEEPRKPSDWFTIHNQLHRLGPLAAKAKRVALEQIPVELRKFGGPVELGDVVLHGRPYDRRWRGQIGYIKVWRPIPVKWMWRRLFDGWDSSHLQMAVALSGTIRSRDPITDRRVGGRQIAHGVLPEYLTDTFLTPQYLTSRGVAGWKVGRLAYSGNALLRASGGGFHLHG